MKKKNKDQTNGWRDGFLFLGNHPVLDFLNTRPALSGEPVELLPDFKAVLRWLRAAGLLTVSQMEELLHHWEGLADAHRTAEEVRQFREKLRKQVIAWESGKAIQAEIITELNRLMAAYPMRSRLSGDRRRPATELWFEARRPQELFAPLAYSAAMLFANVDRERVRKCASCVGHFYDTSKKGTRRWCSMQLCGNRSKVAAYAARRRGGD
jgi:predicted RNA-binding Zn ribbon-like protein